MSRLFVILTPRGSTTAGYDIVPIVGSVFALRVTLIVLRVKVTPGVTCEKNNVFLNILCAAQENFFIYADYKLKNIYALAPVALVSPLSLAS